MTTILVGDWLPRKEIYLVCIDLLFTFVCKKPARRKMERSILRIHISCKSCPSLSLLRTGLSLEEIGLSWFHFVSFCFVPFLTSQHQKNSQKIAKKEWMKLHRTVGIRCWSHTQLLISRSEATILQSVVVCCSWVTTCNYIICFECACYQYFPSVTCRHCNGFSYLGSWLVILLKCVGVCGRCIQ